MSSIFGGFIFLLLDFNFTVNQYAVNVLPNFVGYLLCLKGISELAGEGPSFRKARPWAIGLAIVDAVIWLANLFGMGAELVGTAWSLISLLVMIVGFYFTWLIIKGVDETSRMRGADLNQDRLKTCWIVQVVCMALSYAFVFFIPALAVACALAVLITGIIFLVQLNRTVKLYKAVTNNG